MIFLITTKKSDPENIGKAAKIMYVGVLEPVIWSSVICSKYRSVRGVVSAIANSLWLKMQYHTFDNW